MPSLRRESTLRARALVLSLPLLSLATLLTYACSSSSSAPSSSTAGDAGACPVVDSGDLNATDAAVASCASPGQATAGPADDHCLGDGGVLTVQSTSAASCCALGDAGGPGDCPYGDTMYGQSGGDDDCKYHVSWTSTPLCEGSGGVEFTVVAVHGGTTMPVTGAHIQPEAFLTSPVEAGCDDMSSHESPSTFGTFAEGPPGTYKGRVVFDTPGAWTVRFHLNENCHDVLPDSPHGHAAFHLTLP
jgi:hypothetical protein